MTWDFAPTASVALGLSSGSVHEPIHGHEPSTGHQLRSVTAAREVSGQEMFSNAVVMPSPPVEEMSTRELRAELANAMNAASVHNQLAEA
jgi:hypothetical protein